MTTHPLISEQRIQYIVDSYSLSGSETEGFERYLTELLSQYPPGLIELALVETLVKHWLSVPMQKGVAFLVSAHRRLCQWQNAALRGTPVSILSSSEFSQITGLDPLPAFTALEALDRPEIASLSDSFADSPKRSPWSAAPSSKD